MIRRFMRIFRCKCNLPFVACEGWAWSDDQLHSHVIYGKKPEKEKVSEKQEAEGES